MLNRLFSLSHSPYPLPQPPCWSELQTSQPQNRRAFSRSVLSHLLKRDHGRSHGVHQAKSNKFACVTPREQLSMRHSPHRHCPSCCREPKVLKIKSHFGLWPRPPPAPEAHDSFSGGHKPLAVPAATASCSFRPLRKKELKLPPAIPRLKTEP